MDIQSVIEELWASFRDETDFLVEASNLEKFRSTNKNVAFVTCPKPYKELCTEHVVVMDYIRGIPISDTSGLVAAGYDLTEIGEKLVDNYAHQVLDVGFFTLIHIRATLLFPVAKLHLSTWALLGACRHIIVSRCATLCTP